MTVLSRNSFVIPYQYSVYFTHGVFSPDNPLLAEVLEQLSPALNPLPVMVVLDAGVQAAWPDLQQNLRAWFAQQGEHLQLRGPILVIPGGEPCKDGFAVPQQILTEAWERRLCRQSHIWAIGGGAFLDAVGLGAALFHRGVPLLRFPTTVLSQNDSGVGVKNGCNYAGGKNLAGVFAPPLAVINDSAFLTTLSDRDWRSGIAEAFKVAIIKDQAFLHWLCQHAHQLRERDLILMEELVRRCAILHLQHIQNSGDPFESGSSRPLDFGHWSAHRLESLSGFSLKHGEAVSIGLALDLQYAVEIGLLSADECRCCLTGLRDCGLPTDHELLRARDENGQLLILSGLAEFREHLGGKLHLTLPDHLGHKVEVHEYDVKVVEKIVTATGNHSDMEATGRGK
jgi:3-dehydroquinate synthase